MSLGRCLLPILYKGYCVRRTWTPLSVAIFIENKNFKLILFFQASEICNICRPTQETLRLINKLLKTTVWITFDGKVKNKA